MYQDFQGSGQIKPADLTRFLDRAAGADSSALRKAERAMETDASTNNSSDFGKQINSVQGTCSALGIAA